MFQINNFDTNSIVNDNNKHWMHVEIPVFNNKSWFWKHRPWAIGESNKTLVFDLDCKEKEKENNKEDKQDKMNISVEIDKLLNPEDDVIPIYKLKSGSDEFDTFCKMYQIMSTMHLVTSM